MDLHHLLPAGLPTHSALPPTLAVKADIRDRQVRAKLRRDGPVRTVAGFDFRNSR
jgi:hypothetical protein